MAPEDTALFFLCKGYKVNVTFILLYTNRQNKSRGYAGDCMKILLISIVFRGRT